MSSKCKQGMIYLQQDTPLLQYYQFPEYLLKMPLGQTAKLLYMVIYDRARLSQKNGWIDEKGRIYLVYPLAELAAKTGRSISAVKAGVTELLQADLLEKMKIGFGKPNRLFVRIPSDFSPTEGQDPAPFTDGKPAPKQIYRENTMKQNVHSSFSQYRGKRVCAFENYDYEGEDNF